MATTLPLNPAAAPPALPPNPTVLPPELWAVLERMLKAMKVEKSLEYVIETGPLSDHLRVYWCVGGEREELMGVFRRNDSYSGCDTPSKEDVRSWHDSMASSTPSQIPWGGMEPLRLGLYHFQTTTSYDDAYIQIYWRGERLFRRHNTPQNRALFVELIERLCRYFGYRGW